MAIATEAEGYYRGWAELGTPTETTVQDRENWVLFYHRLLHRQAGETTIYSGSLRTDKDVEQALITARAKLTILGLDPQTLEADHATQAPHTFYTPPAA